MGLNHGKLQEKRTRGGGPGWRPKEGDNKIRILPPCSRYFTEDLDFIAFKFKVHWFNLEGKAEVSRCLEETGLKCPACKAYFAHRKSEDPALKELIKRISPNERYIFNILDLNNLQGGIQRWEAPWSVWDKIMEIAGNPAWGDILSPESGINFNINLTPGQKSRTGFATYSATPEPTRTTVMSVLAAIPDWQAALDGVEDSIPDAKTAAEMVTLLGELGIPGFAGPAATAQLPQGLPQPVAPPPAPVQQYVPQPVGAPPPAAVMPAPTPVVPPPAAVAPAAVMPTPAVAAVAPAPTPAPAPAAAPAAPAAGRTDAKGRPIPDGAPGCFGDYNSQIHPCGSCPVQAPCQLRFLNVG